MRHVLAFSLLLMVLSGCGNGGDQAQERAALSLDDLAVTVRDHPRSYFLSDKRGGIVIGRGGSGVEAVQEWSVNGQTILRNPGQITIDGKAEDQAAIDSVRVTPLEATLFFHSGMIVTLAPVDRVAGEEKAHALAVQVQAPSPRDITLALHAGSSLTPAPHHEPKALLYRSGAGGTLGCSAGSSGEASAGGITVKQASKAAFVMVYAPGDSADVLAGRTQAQADLLRLSRRDRMEKLLQRAYLSTSDPELTRGLRWLQLSLDALTIVSSETTAVTALPWNGSITVRDNAIALAGLDAATGDFAVTGGLLRTLSRHQDASADGGAWFAREAYEHVIASGDTALVREIYPSVLAEISRMQRQTDPFNFVLAKNGPQRGSRVADQQGLWYYQQTIGSIFAMFLGDSTRVARWALMADLTASAFNRMFIDTTRSILYDRVAPNGRGSLDAGPGLLLCLDMIESEVVRQNTVKSVMKAGLRPYGIAAPKSAILNWMGGQMVYALTRYDCQHISYPVTRRLAERVLTTDMVGVLPEMYESDAGGRALGAQASLGAMAEFVRSFYQDYLGVHINMTTRSLALEPKLPDEISDVDFTVFAGNQPVSVRYEREAAGDHVVLNGKGLTDSLRVTFLWMMKNGDAWRGATALHPGTKTTLVFGERDATVFFDGKEAQIENVRHLVGFSQRAQMESF